VNALYSQGLVQIFFASLYIASMCKGNCGNGMRLRIGLAFEAGIFFEGGVYGEEDQYEVMVMAC